MAGLPKNKQEVYTIGSLDTKSSKYVMADGEVLSLVNMDFVTVNAATKRAGTSLYLGATVSGRITGLYEFERLSGASYIMASANTNLYSVTNSFSSVKSGLTSGNIFDFVTFTDRLFAANGSEIFKTDGTNSTNFGLPPGDTSAPFGITGIYNAASSLSGVFIASYGYLNDLGFYGPDSSGYTVTLNGISYTAFLYSGMAVPSGYGITAIALYRSAPGSVLLFGTTLIPTTGATFVDYSPLGLRSEPVGIYFTLAPKYLELYNNQLFLGGFSSMLSTLYWSDVGIPEQIQPQSFAEFRTNDGDRLTGMRAYQNDLIVTKLRSCHRLSGEVPENFSIQQLSDQYGCLSNRTMISYNQQLLWLDEKGIIQYNGADIGIISNKVESIFIRMNVAAAIENACAVHNKAKNQVEFQIPVDGSTINNFTVVYDYLSNRWTTYEGINASSYAIIKGNRDTKRPFYGGYTGSISFFDDTIESDNGLGFTCLIKSRYASLMGQSTEQIFRRFYLNVDAIAGSSQPIGIALRTNYSDIVSATYTIYQSPFQTRIETGLSAKTMSAEISHFSATFSLKVDGWTIESRYQRAV